MATLEEQETLGNLLRQVDNAHYTLYKALFKFLGTANYFTEIPEDIFVEVEESLKAVEESLAQVRMTMVTFIKRECV